MPSSIHPGLTRSLGAFTAATLLACSSSSEKEARQDSQSTVPIPRFPDGGIPNGTHTTTSPADELTRQGQSSASVTSTTKDEGPGPGPGGSTGGVPSSVTSSHPGTTGSTGTTTGPTGADKSSDTSSEEGPDTSGDPGPEPKEARFVDLAHFILDQFDDGRIKACEKYEHQQFPGVHQNPRLGNERFPDPRTHNGRGNRTRSFYMAFDTSKIRRATGAYIDFYLFAANDASAGSGDYDSPDPEETVAIHSIDRFSADELIAAPFGGSNETRNHDIFSDFEDGDLYARFTVSKAMLAQEHLSPAPTNPQPNMDCSDTNRRRTCGRWLRIDLSEAAVRDINASRGTWAMGWSLESKDYFRANEEDVLRRFGEPKTIIRSFLFFGAYIDKAFMNTRRPEPRLVVTYE